VLWRHRDRRRQGQGAAVLRAAGAQQTGQPTRVDVGDRDGAFASEVGLQRLGHPEIRRQDRQIPNHQAGGEDLRRLDVLVADPIVADVRICQRDDLPAVARVGEDFLVAGQGRVEHDLADRVTGSTDRNTLKDRAICEGQDCLGLGNEQLQRH
jgi:hypothetical protein